MIRKSKPLLSRLLAHGVLAGSSRSRLRDLAFTSQLVRAMRLLGPTLFALSIYAGAVICFGGLIFAGIRMLSGRFSDAIPGLFGALFGAGVLGWGAGWIGTSARR